MSESRCKHRSGVFSALFGGRMRGKRGGWDPRCIQNSACDSELPRAIISPFYASD